MEIGTLLSDLMNVREESKAGMLDISPSDWRGHNQSKLEGSLSPEASWFCKTVNQGIGILSDFESEEILCVCVCVCVDMFLCLSVCSFWPLENELLLLRFSLVKSAFTFVKKAPVIIGSYNRAITANWWPLPYGTTCCVNWRLG